MVGDARPVGKGPADSDAPWFGTTAQGTTAPGTMALPTMALPTMTPGTAPPSASRARRWRTPAQTAPAEPAAKPPRVARPYPRDLPVELQPFVGHLPLAVLREAAARARQVGVGGDEVLVARGLVDDATATSCLAEHLGLRVEQAAPHRQVDGPPLSAETARGVLRTSIRLQSAGRPGQRPRFTLAARGREVRRLARALRQDASLAGRVTLTSPAALRRAVLDTAGPQLTEAAVLQLPRGDPLRSAATLVPGRLLARGALAAGVPLAVAALLAPLWTVLALQALLSLVFLAWIAIRLAACLYEPPEDIRPALADRHLPLYSILVPLYREAASVPGLVAALGALDYPPEKLDIKLVVEADDSATRAAIAALGLPPHMEEVAVPPLGPRTKPKALDVALAFTRGSYVAIYDAEDLPEPDQLRRALEAFRAGGPRVACVQARLCTDNGDERWIAGQFAAEYAGQFDVLLPMLSALGLPILLGGTSNHFRRRVLEEVGAWDPFNVTEDADLGIRLARAGYETRVIASTTFEEAPVACGVWVGQRTRWLKGWAQTLLVHLRRPRALVRDLGPRATAALLLLTMGPFAAALVHPFCTVVLAADVVRGVIGLPCTSLAEVLTSALTYTTLAAGYAGTGVLQVAALRRRGLVPHWSVVAGLPLYWMLLSLAAWRALVELVRRPHFWRKTEHGVARRAAGAALRPGVRTGAAAPPQPRSAAAWN